jgi:hypothetical protein
MIGLPVPSPASRVEVARETDVSILVPVNESFGDTFDRPARDFPQAHFRDSFPSVPGQIQISAARVHRPRNFRLAAIGVDAVCAEGNWSRHPFFSGHIALTSKEKSSVWAGVSGGLWRLHAIHAMGRPLCFGFITLLTACQHSSPRAAPFLPSHPPGEMFPRASSPPPDCPGQYRTTIEDAGGSIFLGCWGTRTD